MDKEVKKVSVEDMVSLVEYIAKSLVDTPDEVKTNLNEDEEAITIEL